MGLEIRQEQGTAFVDVQDEMTIYTAALQWEQLQPLLAQVKAVDMNLSAVSEMDSAGIQLLLALKQASDRLHNRFVLTAPAPCVEDLLQLLRLRSVLMPAEEAETDG
ncbi:STAS domain-containing protein [Marinobacterium weihaiense]|uniref:STAS domain-containing protein n=1 Tax=Marinobacterium weihaiense TaxID=2851016 RepID=A0ABS6M9K7_9GAMM|nr:STAS domain-containing protein [Marinobacterium weihaiense]MBV0932968.1 STAS domain-containing protein [Marinobacterium weihaiense]